MSAKTKGWTCQRRRDGEACRAYNPPRTRKCARCGGARPARKRPAHMAALEASYDAYLTLNGGDWCGVCLQARGARRLDRDHDHRTGKPRGLLCHRCNRALPAWMTADWLRAAIRYLERV